MRPTPVPRRATKSRRAVQVLLVLVAAAIAVDGLVGDRGLLAMFRARRQHDDLAATIGQKTVR